MSKASNSTDLRASAKEAWLWGLPLIETAQQRSARAREGVHPNDYQHQRKLMDAGESFVTTPNNDTLYSQAWIDLNQGPVKLSIPSTGKRYFSLALMDMYTNNFAILGTRTTGDDGGAFTLVGPEDATSEPGIIRSPTRWVWALGRTLVEGEADLPAAIRVQDQLSIEGARRNEPIPEHADRNAPWGKYFASVQALMNENPPPATDNALLQRISSLIRLGSTFDPSRFSEEEVEAIKAGIADARSATVGFRRALGAVNGWTTSGGEIGAFRQNYGQRAATALGGLAALPRYEAMYFGARGSDALSGFDSSKGWKLTFTAADMPPVDSFWSLSLYRRTAEGQHYFVDNPINRYAIGDRTPGLKRDADESLTIWMTRTDPGGEATSNWLPTPTGEDFVLTLRAYIPRQEMLDGQYRVPKVVEL